MPSIAARSGGVGLPPGPATKSASSRTKRPGRVRPSRARRAGCGPRPPGGGTGRTEAACDKAGDELKVFEDFSDAGVPGALRHPPGQFPQGRTEGS